MPSNQVSPNCSDDRHEYRNNGWRYDRWEDRWAQLLPLLPDLPGQRPILHESTHRSFDDALRVAQSYLVRWDPFIDFFGLPNEAQLGYSLSGVRGEHGELVLEQPDTWMLRWNAPPEVVSESWAMRVEDIEAGIARVDGRVPSTDRRARLRRATDRGRAPAPWIGVERRRGCNRRATDQRV
jgi:hypothetical protein